MEAILLLKNLKFFSLTADLILAQVSILHETIKRLLPQKLKDQYAFKSEKALKALILSEVVER